MTVMITVLLSFAVMLLAIGIMSIGVLQGRAPIKGSCGGLNGGACDLCTRKCERNTQHQDRSRS